MIKMFSDAYFKVGTLDTAQLVADNNVPVFQYRYLGLSQPCHTSNKHSSPDLPMMENGSLLIF